jgi:hypothetical protein
MPASRLDNSGVFRPVTIQADTDHLVFPPHAVRIRRNGIEFQSAKSFPVWTEMTVALKSPGEERKLKCTGVVVDCVGNRHTGYTVSLLFLNLSRQSQERLDTLAGSCQL